MNALRSLKVLSVDVIKVIWETYVTWVSIHSEHIQCKVQLNNNCCSCNSIEIYLIALLKM